MKKGKIVYDENKVPQWQDDEEGDYLIATDVVELSDGYAVGIDSMTDDAIEEMKNKEIVSLFIDKVFLYSFVDENHHRWYDAVDGITKYESGVYTFLEAKKYFIDDLYSSIFEPRQGYGWNKNLLERFKEFQKQNGKEKRN